MKSISELLDEIDVDRLDCSYEVDQWVSRELAKVRGDVIKFQRDDAYQRYIRRYIAENYDPDDHDGKPRCTCGNDCPVLDEKLPAMVKGADAPGRAQEEWAIRHPGTPHALLTADDAYREDLAALYNDLSRIVAATRRDIIPKSATGGDDEPEAGETDTDDEEAEVTA